MTRISYIFLCLTLGMVIGFGSGTFIEKQSQGFPSSSSYGEETIFYGHWNTVTHQGYESPSINNWQVMLDFYWDCFARYPKNTEELKELGKLHATKFGYIQFESKYDSLGIAPLQMSHNLNYGYDPDHQFRLTYLSETANEYLLTLEKTGRTITVKGKRN